MDLKDPQTQRVLLGVILLAGLGYAFYQYLYTPKQLELAELESQAQRLETYNESAKRAAQSDRIADLEEESVSYARRLEAFEELIPTTEQVPLLLERVATAALESDVDLLAFTPLPSEPGAFYTEQLYEVEVRGGYHEIGAFLTRIATLPRIVRPGVTELMSEQVQESSGRPSDPAAPPAPQTVVRAKMQLSTYVLPGGEAPAAGADTSRATAAPIGLGAAPAAPGAPAAPDQSLPPPAGAAPGAPAPPASGVSPMVERFAPGVAPAVEAERARAAAVAADQAAAERAAGVTSGAAPLTPEASPPAPGLAAPATGAPTAGAAAAPPTAAPAPATPPAAPQIAAPAPAPPAVGELPPPGVRDGQAGAEQPMPGDVPPLGAREP